MSSVKSVVPVNSSEMAAWVQAFGSIGAILGAVWVASNQRRAQEKDALARSHLVESHVRLLAERALRAVDIQYKDNANLMSKLNLISGLTHSLDSINLLDLPSLALLEPVSTLRDALRGLEEGMRQAQKDTILAYWISSAEAITFIALVAVSSRNILEVK
ncbi:hypothetical protein [Pseudomonas putida]|uniref:Uncharacterized protein n=1 Tax=Pseudomonas putida TaxID=303 RepID=A0AAW4BZK5_PSEPU|nr:hypothetical protein [Pseudomonas putida]MBF8703975.1 hypothetical protein [Pseudomonas putida]MBF8738721.1 hypothetical protein [Pseudomonas putida]